MYFKNMDKKAVKKAGPKRDKNKVFLGAWIDRKIYDAVNEKALQEGHKNASIILIQSLVKFLGLKIGEKKED